MTPQMKARVAEVRWLLGAGESPAQVARQLGLKPGSLAKSLQRAKQPELARPFWRAERKSPIRATHPCADCGGPCSRAATRCRGCSNRANTATPEWRAKAAAWSARRPRDEHGRYAA